MQRAAGRSPLRETNLAAAQPAQIAVLGNNHVEHAENRSPGNKQLTTAATCTQHPQEQIVGKNLTCQWGVMKGQVPQWGRRDCPGFDTWERRGTKGTAAGAAGVCWAGQPWGLSPFPRFPCASSALPFLFEQIRSGMGCSFCASLWLLHLLSQHTGMEKERGAVGCFGNLQWTFSGTFQTPGRLWGFQIHQTKGELLKRALGSAVARARDGEHPKKPCQPNSPPLTVLGAAAPGTGRAFHREDGESPRVRWGLCSLPATRALCPRGGAVAAQLGAWRGSSPNECRQIHGSESVY